MQGKARKKGIPPPYESCLRALRQEKERDPPSLPYPLPLGGGAPRREAP